MMFTPLKPARFPWFDYSRYSFSLGLQSAAGTYLSGHTASEYDAAAKRIVVRGGMGEQVRTAYAKIGAILEAGGLGFGDVVRVVEYLRPEGIERYAEAAAARAEVFGKHQPVVNTVPVKSLLRPEAFLEIEVTATSRPAEKASSGVVYLPTVQPVDDQGNIIGAGDVVAQTQAIFERAGRMLAALGLGFDRVVKTLDYLTPAGLTGAR
jgi:enamine deaminase RidA (YjgF/YER057c/UK114 family)